jgi:phosphate-selective porin OprO/OprP
LPIVRPLALVLLASVSPGLALASSLDPEVTAEMSALRAELARLQARLEQLEARQQATAAAPLDTPKLAQAEVSAGPGLEVEGADAKGSFSIGGRIHYDLYAHDTGRRPAAGGSEFRRARVKLDGEAAGWNYRLQVELSGGEVDLRDVYVERALGESTLTIGQFKPFRAMEELASSNDLSVMERGFTTASGLFADRQWQQGVGLLRALPAGSLGVSAFSLREDNSPRNEGWGAAARGTWAPILDSDRVIHLGLWGSLEEGGERTPGVGIEAAYAGRRGPSALLFQSLDGSDFAQRSAGLEFAGRLGAFHWQSEWAHATLAGAEGDGRLEAAYLQAGWVFGGGGREYDVGEGLFGGMQEVGDGRWEAVARIDRIRLRNADGVEARRVVLGLNRYLNEELRLMFNWIEGEVLGLQDDAGQLGVRVQYVF